MLTLEQRKHLARRWREIVRNTEATAVEWPEIAHSLRELAAAIEAGELESDRED